MDRLVSTPEGIIQELLKSKENGTAIGINSPKLGEDMIVTAVDEIIMSGLKPVIVLKNYDMSGYMLTRNKLTVDEIKSVFPFTSKFENPFLKGTEERREEHGNDLSGLSNENETMPSLN